MSEPDVVPLVLAAGAGTRLGGCKAAIPVAGRSMLARVLASAAAAGLPPAVVVAGADPAAVHAALAASGLPARVVEHPGWAAGRTSSLQAGLRALPGASREGGAFLLWPVDVCLVGPELVRALLAARAAQPTAEAWLPSHAGRRGHPALFPRALADAFLALGPDEPAHRVVRGLRRIVHVEGGEACLVDIDTPEELAAAEAEPRAGGPPPPAPGPSPG